jgi:hypothetical protein
MKPMTRMLARISYAQAEALTRRVALALAPALAACMLLWAVDARTLDTGESVWLKPMRFCLAFGVHLATVLWLGRFSGAHASGSRLYAVGLWLQAVTVLVEMACIGLQAARGVHSHFNYATPLDHAVFTIMGLGTAATLLGLLLCAWGVWRAPAARITRQLLLGAMALAVVGGLVGVLMVMPTAEQRAWLDAGRQLPWIGGVDVGTPSGRVLPLLAWDLRSGDWRSAHFVGLHALQALPLLAWLALRAGADGAMPAGARVPRRAFPGARLWACTGAFAYAGLLLAVLGWTASGRSSVAIAEPGWWIVGAPLAVFALAVAVLAVQARFRRVG